jgi:hypothetical protein
VCRPESNRCAHGSDWLGYLSFREPAQNGRGIERAALRSIEFLHCLAACIRALCAFL